MTTATNATISKEDPVTVTRLGDEAFTHRRFAGVTGPASDVDVTLEVRRVNRLVTG